MKLVSGKVLESAESMILDVYGPVDVPGGVEGVPGRTRGGHEGEGLELAEGLGGARCSAKMPEVSEAGDGDLGEEAGGAVGSWRREISGRSSFPRSLRCSKRGS